jgi:uncharacterized protein
LISAGTVAILLFAVLSTSFLSGIFGMAGGIILMGVCVWLFSVSQAMVLQGIIQVASNGCRAALYFRHIVWRVMPGFIFGNLLALGFFAWLAYVPDKAMVYLMLGIMPFVGMAMRGSYALDITKRGAPTACGLIVATLQLTSGVTGPVLDSFFLKSPVTRYQVVATKAVTQTISHIIKLIYFGLLVTVEGPAAADLPWWLFALSVPLVFAGTSLAKRVLDTISDKQFFRWSTWVIAGIGTFFLSRAALLLWP